MLMQEPSPDLIRSWKELFETYRPILRPNHQPCKEVIAHLKNHYPVTCITKTWAEEVVIGNVTLNEHYAQKIPPGGSPVPRVYIIQKTGTGESLYENQDERFRGTPIIAGFDLPSGYFMVEGSSRLWDELFVFRGLDQVDIENYYLVAEYITGLQKFGILERVLKNQPDTAANSFSSRL